jgi:hypothetical protein
MSYSKVANKAIDMLKNPSPATIAVLSLFAVCVVCALLIYFAGATFAMPILVFSPNLARTALV